MTSRSQWRVAPIMTSLSWHHHHHHDVIYFAFTKMADSQNYRMIGKNTPNFFPSINTFCGLIFRKPLTCIRNDIVLQVYFNPKCNENWRKAAYHASSDSACCQLAYTLCVCVYVWCQALIFQKPLTCIRNDIVLQVYFNPKCNENWRKAAYHASSDSACCQLAYTLCVCVCVCVCVWCQASEFCTGHFTS